LFSDIYHQIVNLAVSYNTSPLMIIKGLVIDFHTVRLS